jgi:ferredoxin
MVLDALLRQGALIQHSCRKGTCRVCTLRLLRGDVEHLREVALGLLADRQILPCVARARGDLELAGA